MVIVKKQKQKNNWNVAICICRNEHEPRLINAVKVLIVNAITNINKVTLL